MREGGRLMASYPFLLNLSKLWEKGQYTARSVKDYRNLDILKGLPG